MAPKRKSTPSSALTGREQKRAKFCDTRVICTQTTDAAFSNGELKVDHFVKAREFEIKALEDGLKRARKGLSTRAHQELPRELRRRTASHNVKRVPKRLQARARKEMVEDNAPTVTSRRRKPSGHQRLRLETAQRLEAISRRNKERRSAKNVRKPEDELQVLPESAEDATRMEQVKTHAKRSVRAKKAKIRTSRLREPPIPPAKFRKRQIQKTWLPTHLWHAKRARMTPPKEPMWRFALPLTPNIKSYRNIHRASSGKGAIAWDTSYMSTIGLQGWQESIAGLLEALGVFGSSQEIRRWRSGSRFLETWVHERDQPDKWIAPVVIVWNPIMPNPELPCSDSNAERPAKKPQRKIFIRVHPSAFLQLWEQVVRLAKVQKPSITVEDLRYEVGSIEITGPNASEALVAVLRPLGTIDQTNGILTAAEMVWTKLACTPASALPINATMAMSITDPRLRFPSQTLRTKDHTTNDTSLLQILCNWPLDRNPRPGAIFDHRLRVKAKRNMPTQKRINKRKGQAEPGAYPTVLTLDPLIPVMVLASRSGSENYGSWTVLMPWSCVSALWKPLLHYPLSMGGTIRFGGVNEKRQLAYEIGQPWFPADFPATKAGQQWEYDESKRRESEWKRKPRSRRAAYESLDLGNGNTGEIGSGHGCDWQRLVQGSLLATEQDLAMVDASECTSLKGNGTCQQDKPTAMESSLLQLSSTIAGKALDGDSSKALPTNAIVTVKVTMLGRGCPMECARIYRLPTNDTELRKTWLAQQPTQCSAKLNTQKAKMWPKPSNDAHAAIQRSWLATAILTQPPEPGQGDYPRVPDQQDLIGYITTGNFSLKEGRGVGIGSVLVSRVLPDNEDCDINLEGLRLLKATHRLCIVRNPGQVHGRLAFWELL